MKTVLEEVTSDTIDAEHVERRVDDWEKRLKGLYAAIGEWLPDDWEARPGSSVLMHEKLMQEFGITARRLSTLEIHGRSGEVVTLGPRGLWIIGNNGRVDLKRGRCRYHIIDMADNFEEPDWQAAPADDRSNCESVTREWLRRILR